MLLKTKLMKTTIVNCPYWIQVEEVEFQEMQDTLKLRAHKKEI